MCELLRGVATRVGIKEARDGVKYLYRTADCRMEHEKLFPCNEEDKATVLWEVSEQERHITGLDGGAADCALLPACGAIRVFSTSCFQLFENCVVEVRSVMLSELDWLCRLNDNGLRAPNLTFSSSSLSD